jgi:16S rRNA processing protein RimM
MADEAAPASDWLHAGVIASPHGLDGSFHVTAARPQLLVLGAHVRIGGRELQITRRAGHDRRVILGIEGCESREGAEALRGSELLVPRAAAPALGDEEWWAEDLEGCSVRDGERAVGVVRRLLALPSCEVLEVAREDRDGDLLVPLVGDAVRSVDIEQRTIDIDLAFLGEA